MTDGDLRQLIAAKLVAVERRDWYALLDVEPSAPSDEVRRAYHQLIKLLHPDRLKRRDLGELQDGSNDVFKALTDGYQVLSNVDARKRYDLEQQSAPKAKRGKGARRGHVVSRPPPEKGEPQIPKGITEKELLNDPVERFSPTERQEIARWMLQGGANLFAKADYQGAEKYFRRAIELDATRPVYSLRLGWTIFRNPARSDEERKEAARPYLESASARDAYSAEARYALSQYLREFGTPEQYRRELTAVLRCDEAHVRAQQELVAVEAQLSELQERNVTGRMRRMDQGTLGVARRPEPKNTGIRSRLKGLFSRNHPEAPRT